MSETLPITKLILSFLMLIGGAPGSTSGGIRITSIAILVLTVRATLRNKRDVVAFYKKIDVHDLKKELINLIYEVRYYNLLPIDNTRKIKDLKELEVDRRNMQKKLITKLCDNKVIDQITKDYNVNYKILKYIFVAKMTNINKIQIKLKYIDRKLIIEYYDENILESKESINFSDDDYNELIKRVDRKMRIFI